MILKCMVVAIILFLVPTWLCKHKINVSTYVLSSRQKFLSILHTIFLKIEKTETGKIK